MPCSVCVGGTGRPRRGSKRLFLSSCTLLAAAAFAVPAWGQTVTELEGIVIQSANRTPTEASKVGSSVEVLTEKDLEKQSKTFLKDYLEQLPGVSFNQGGPPGSTTSISIRGAALRYVKVLVDGIDISDPSGATTAVAFEHLLVGDVSRIEVLKGSQSTLYGGEAVGGVISVETKAARRPGFSHSGGAEGGRYGTFRGAYTAGYAAQDGSNVSFTVQGIETDGFSAAASGTEDDGYRNLTVSGRGTLHISDSVSMFFALRSLDARYEYDSNAPPPVFVVDSPNVGYTEQHAGRAGVQIDLLDGRFQNTFAIQGMEIERELPGITYYGDRVKAEYKGVLSFNDRLSLLAGADWEELGAEHTFSLAKATSQTTGVFAQLMMEPVDGLVLTGGGRIDEHSAFGQFNTYRFTGAYLVPGTETKLRASFGTGFRAPALDELYADGYGNATLEPEESESWDVGVEQGFLNGRVMLSATYFELDTSNLIFFDLTFPCFAPPFDPCAYNIPGVTQRKGVELSAAALVIDGLAVTASYTYVDTEMENGDPLVRVPRHSFVVGVDIEPADRVALNVTAKYVADTLDNQDLLLPLDDYLLLSAKASYEFLPGWKAYVRGENLLDENYQIILGYKNAGLSVFGGITMSLPSD